VVCRTGSVDEVPIQARLIIGTQTPLDDLVGEEKLIPDLSSRLEHGPELPLPTLRSLAAAAFADVFDKVTRDAKYKTLPKGQLRDALWKLTCDHVAVAWPYNVRGLIAALEWVRIGQTIEEACDRLRGKWLRRQKHKPLDPVPVGQFKSLMSHKDDVYLLAELLAASIPQKNGTMRARSPSGGRPTNVERSALDLSDMLLSNRPSGTRLADLAHVLDYKPSERRFRQIIEAWTAHGLVTPIYVGEERAAALLWPIVRVTVSVLEGDRPRPWSPVTELGDGDVLRIHVHTRTRCRVRIASVEHPLDAAPDHEAVDWREPEDEGTLIDTSGGRFEGWSFDRELDGSLGWEQFIIHVRPILPPSVVRGSRSVGSRRARLHIDQNAVLAARERARQEWGRGWMTDFIVHKVSPTQV